MVKAQQKYLVAMDDGHELWAGGPLSGVEGAVPERIPGKYQVTRQDGQIHLWPKFNERDLVRVKASVTSQVSGARWDAGSEGYIISLHDTMEECWSTGNYNVWLDPDPAHGESGIVELHADVLELVSEGGGN